MKDVNKNVTIAILIIFLVFFALTFIINNWTGRSWDDAIIKAETHHIITGEYYNTYKILDADSSYIKIESRADFSETYAKDLTTTVIED